MDWIWIRVVKIEFASINTFKNEKFVKPKVYTQTVNYPEKRGQAWRACRPIPLLKPSIYTYEIYYQSSGRVNACLFFSQSCLKLKLQKAEAVGQNSMQAKKIKKP